jgi:hypothetical protein
MAAAHEHCADILAQGSPSLCRHSIRCAYFGPNGRIQDANATSDGDNATAVDGDGDAANGSGSRASSFLMSGSNSSSGSSGKPHNGNSTGMPLAFWQQVAAGLKLRAPACVPNPRALTQLRQYACGRSTTAPRGAAGEALLRACTQDPTACFVRDASNQDEAAAWWRGVAPQAALESSSSWRAPGRLSNAAAACSDAWARNTSLVQAVCATRGTGRGGFGATIRLGRLAVALLDGFEASGCNNTITFSEDMAVQRLVSDLACSGGTCVARAAASGAGARPQLAALVPALAALAAACLAAALVV